MSDSPVYLLDSDVLITAKNAYYSFAICPGFWASLLHGHSRGHIQSIDRVRQELLAGRDDEDLALWVQRSVPADFFLDSGVAGIVEAYSQVMLWATRHTQYLDAAKAKFATGADGWLVAHGLATGKLVVTNEQPAPGSKTSIKLPDVCEAFNVPYRNTFAILHDLGYRYDFNSTQGS